MVYLDNITTIITELAALMPSLVTLVTAMIPIMFIFIVYGFTKGWFNNLLGMIKLR